MAAELRNSGIAPLGEIAWGTHVCHFFESGSDLVETIVPYFAAGLAGGELCFCLIPDAMETLVTSAFRNALPDYEQQVSRGALQIASAPEWFRTGGVFDASRVAAAWDQKVGEALRNGFVGLRVDGCGGWLDGEEWPAFHAYEQSLDGSIQDKKMIVLCSYPLPNLGAARILDIARSHQYVLTRRGGDWELLESAELREARNEIQRLNRELQQRVQERTAQLHARSCQQAAVARLGQSAIRERDLGVLMREVTALAAQTLGTGRSIVWRLRPEQKDLVLCAQTGWDVLPPDATIPLDPGTAAAYVVGNETPLMMDAHDDSRFRRSWLLREHNVATMISSVIRARERTWGILSIHSLTPRAFTKDDVEFLQSMANVLSLAIERHEHEERQRTQSEVLQTIVDHSPVMMTFLDPSDQIVYSNPAVVQNIGWTTREAQEMDILPMVYPDPELLERVRAFVRERSGRWEDFQMTTRSGRIVDATWALFRLSNGTTIGFGVDITERKRAEEAQTKALAKLRAIESITDDAVGRMTFDDMLHELLSRLRESLGAGRAYLGIMDEGDGQFFVRASVPAELRDVRIPLLASARASLFEGQPIILNDLPPPDAEMWRPYAEKQLTPPHAVMGAPMIVQGKLIGVVAVASLTPREFKEDELDVLRMVADRVAPAIERSRLIETIRAGSERLESLSHRLLTVQEEERRRLAVELHDELGQIHTAIKLKLGSLRRRLRNQAARAELLDVMEIVDRAVGTAHDLALDLRPAMLDDLGLAAALRWYADRFAKQTGVAIHLALPALPPISSGVATVCFRVVQEALTNVARHAHARNVWIELRVDGSLELLVRDDGAGFDVDAARTRAIGGASLGILGMEERVSLVSGRFQIASTNAGTTITARIPLGSDV